MPSPSRSILMIPMSAQSSLSHWTMRRSAMVAGSIGTTSSRRPAAITIPPLCWPRWRGRPWTARTRSTQCFTSGESGSSFASRRRARNSCWTSACGILAAGCGDGFVRASFACAAAWHGRKVHAGDELREPADRLGILSENFAHLPDRHLDPVGDHVRGHRRSGEAVFPEDVLDHFLALIAGGQVDVDVRPLAAFLGEKTFEEEVHADGVDSGDAERITNGAVGCRAASLAEDAVGTGKGRDVFDDQEIAGEIELLDDFELVGELGATRESGRAP